MSEYNGSTRQEECCGESVNDDDTEDIFDDPNNADDTEVMIDLLFTLQEEILFRVVIRKIVVLSMWAFALNGRK